MCFGGNQPQAPQIQYQGPSDSDLRRNEQQLQTYQQQMQAQQAQTAATIQQQIDDANARTAELQKQYDDEIAAATGDATAAETAAAAARADEVEAKKAAAAAAGASYTPVGAYGVTASQSEAPSAQTTEPIKKKQKPKTTLKISPTATGTAGSGLNIGV